MFFSTYSVSNTVKLLNLKGISSILLLFNDLKNKINIYYYY